MPEKKTQPTTDSTYQDQFLDKLKKKKAPVFIYLISGIKLTGIIKDFDTYTISLDYGGQEQVIFKHAITTVIHQKPPGSE
jgi:host factor-I protein